jgi:type II secretion system protein N
MIGMTQSTFSWRYFLYFAYAVALTVILLYVRFPADKFQIYCTARVERLLQGSTCKIDRIVYRFPISAVFESIKIGRVIDGQESDLVIDRLEIYPEPLKFWSVFKLKGEIYSGLFDMDLVLNKQAQTFQLANIHFADLDAGDLTESIGITEREISGIVQFSGNYQAQNSQPGNGTGDGFFQVSTGSMSLLQPILALSTIEFDQVAMSLAYEDGLLNLVGGELLGKDIVADFTGELRMASPFLNSNILLSGNMEPDSGFLASHPAEQQVVQRLLQRYKMTVLPFKVGGTVKRPLFRFST